MTCSRKQSFPLGSYNPYCQRNKVFPLPWPAQIHPSRYIFHARFPVPSSGNTPLPPCKNSEIDRPSLLSTLSSRSRKGSPLSLANSFPNVDLPLAIYPTIKYFILFTSGIYSKSNFICVSSLSISGFVISKSMSVEAVSSLSSSPLSKGSISLICFTS